MKKLVIAVAILVMVCFGASSVAAMNHGASGPKIYWTASGLFGPLPISVLLPQLSERSGPRHHDPHQYVDH